MTSGSTYDYELEGSSTSGVTFKFNLEKDDIGFVGNGRFEIKPITVI